MKIAVALIAMISCTVAENLMLRIGATAAGQRFFFGLLAWQSVVGILSFGCSLLIYTWVLRLIPLNLALSFASAQFIGAMLAAAVVLSEPISPLRWKGIATIAFGILLVGLSVRNG